jgi:hypothetical protein
MINNEGGSNTSFNFNARGSLDITGPTNLDLVLPLATTNLTATVVNPAGRPVVGAYLRTSQSTSWSPDGMSGSGNFSDYSYTDSTGTVSFDVLDSQQASISVYPPPNTPYGSVNVTTNVAGPTARTIALTVTGAGPPTPTIASPSSGGFYNLGQLVPTSFSCADSPSGLGIASCADNNSSASGTGKLDTSSAGSHTYVVTATSNDGLTNTSSISYTVIGPPVPTISSPAGGGTYSVGQNVPTSFSCAEATNGPGVTSCMDSNGSVSGSGALITSAPGNYDYSVTAVSGDGQSYQSTIDYTVATGPSATIVSPGAAGTYAVGQVVATSFSCADSTYGPGISSCTDSNGSISGSGDLITTTPGNFVYSVTADSSDGQTYEATVQYTVAAAPTATITSPTGGGTYAVGQVVATSFSCSDSFYGSGISSCIDSNGSPSGNGDLVTSTPGTHEYSVTATSDDGQTYEATIQYTVAAAPTATIASPTGGATYSVGQVVATSFSCADSKYGTGISSCIDSNGSASGSGDLATSAPGIHEYSVTATSDDGQTYEATVQYTVAAAPTATITSPTGGGTYSVGQVVATSFSCGDSTYGTGIASCIDSNGLTSGSGDLVTTTPGNFVYSVTATSEDGQTYVANVDYTVATAPGAPITSPSGGGTYSVGQVVATSFSCADSTYGPGISSCVDSNGSPTGSGDLVTTTPGNFSYSVTATSKDGQTSMTTIYYTVAAGPTATIASPSGGGTYSVGQVVSTSFSCTDSTYGTGIASCTDSNGSTSGTGALVTTTPGNFAYSVNAISEDGQSYETTIHYTVAAAPTATIGSPVSGGTYAVDHVVPTSFSCADSSYGSGIASCTDSNGSTSGTGALVTSTPGNFTYSVTAVSKDGQKYKATISYTVINATLTITASSGAMTYGQPVPAVAASYAGFVDGDTASSLSVKPTCWTTATSTSAPGPYPTVCSGAVDDKYIIEYVGGTITVAPVTPTASDFQVLAVSGTDLTVSGGDLLLSKAGVLDSKATNALLLSGGASAAASGGFSSPGWCAASGGSHCPPITHLAASPPDPFAALPAPSASGLTHYSDGVNHGCGVYTTTLAISSTTTVLNPNNRPDCIYYLENGISVSGSSVVTTSSAGVLLYVVGGSFTCSGQARCNIAGIADAYSIYSGLSLFEARGNTSPATLSGGTGTQALGFMYLPSAPLVVSGGATVAATGIVCYTGNLSGGSVVKVS